MSYLAKYFVSVCLLFLSTGPGAIALTRIVGANFMAAVFVIVCNPVLLIVYEKKCGVSLNIL